MLPRAAAQPHGVQHAAQLVPALMRANRARKLQWFFTQPFAVAESFTGRPAQVVPLAATIRACGALLAGAYDDLPEEAFLWRGTLAEVRPATP